MGALLRPSNPALISFFSRLSFLFWIFPSARVFRASLLLRDHREGSQETAVWRDVH